MVITRALVLMGWFKKVFRKSKGKRSSDQSTENEGQNDASDHSNKPEPEEGDNRQPEAPEENKDEENTNRVAPEVNKDEENTNRVAPEINKDEENTNRVAPTLPDRESPPHRPDEPDYHPWSISGPWGWCPAGYHQREDYHRGGSLVYGGEASEQRNWGSFSHAPQYIDHGDLSSERYTGYDNFAGSSGQVNNYWSPPRMLDYDRWNRGHNVNSEQDVWTSDYWKGLFQTPHGGWS